MGEVHLGSIQINLPTVTFHTLMGANVVLMAEISGPLANVAACRAKNLQTSNQNPLKILHKIKKNLYLIKINRIEEEKKRNEEER
jgi:hypothetical protein